MGQQRQFAPGHDGACTTVKDFEHELGADTAGIVGVMRLGAVADDGCAQLDHFFRHIGMVVQAEHDGYGRPQHCAAGLQLLALNIIHSHGGAGTVELQRKRVNAACGLQPEPNLLFKKRIGSSINAPARHGPATNNGHHFYRFAAGLYGINKTTDLPYATVGAGDRWAFNNTKRFVVAQRGCHRVEVVGFLSNMD